MAKRIPKLILTTTQTETPESDVLDKSWDGDYLLVCTAYNSDPVKVQFKHPYTDEWIDMKDGANDLQLVAKGDTQIVSLSEGLDIRVKTASAGAEVFITRQNIRVTED